MANTLVRWLWMCVWKQQQNPICTYGFFIRIMSLRNNFKIKYGLNTAC